MEHLLSLILLFPVILRQKRRSELMKTFWKKFGLLGRHIWLKYSPNSLINFLKKAFVGVFVTTMLVLPLASVQAQDIGQVLKDANKGAQLPGFEGTTQAHASIQPGARNITSALLSIVDLFQYVLGALTVLIIIISAVRLVSAGKNVEDVANSQKENLKYIAIGLVVVFLAIPTVKLVFFGEQGEIYTNTQTIQDAAVRGSNELKAVYDVIELFIGALAILMIIIAGVRLLTSGGNDDAIDKSKKQIKWAVLGLILIGISELVIKDIIFPNQGSELPDVERGKQLIIDFTNFIAGFLATVAIALCMYAGVLYVMDTGKDENAGKAKKILLGAIVGLIIVMGAYALIYTVVDFGG